MESVEVCVSWLGHHGCKNAFGAFPGFVYLDDMIENKF